MSILISEVKKALIEGQFDQVVQIGEKKWQLSFSVGKEKKYLNICLKSPFCSFHLYSHKLRGVFSRFEESIRQYFEREQNIRHRPIRR